MVRGGSGRGDHVHAGASTGGMVAGGAGHVGVDGAAQQQRADVDLSPAVPAVNWKLKTVMGLPASKSGRRTWASEGVHHAVLAVIERPAGPMGMSIRSAA